MFQQNILQGPGTGTFTTHTFEILLMLAGAFLFGLWFGWILWSRYRQQAEKLRLDNESLNASLTALRGEMDGLKARLTESDTERSALAAQVQNLSWENENARNQMLLLQSDLGKILERNRQLESELGMSHSSGEDDNSIPLEIATPVPVEPEDANTGQERGVVENFADDDEQEPGRPEPEYIVTESVHTTEEAEQWTPGLPPQEGRDERITMIPISALVAPQADQQEAQHPEPEPQPEAKATPETEDVVATIVSGPRDDLKIVEGIGPKIEELLFKAGVNTYGQLAATSVQQLKEMLADAGPRFSMHDPGTWSAQALLAANGEWENLKAYQDFLNAGKRPDK